jgi:hypothetical protein
MTEYRAYLIGYHGRIQGYEPLSCANEAYGLPWRRDLAGYSKGRKPSGGVKKAVKKVGNTRKKLERRLGR